MTRKEAIKIIRDARCTSPLRNALETLIPELRESEDERIRKDLITYLKSVQGETLDLTISVPKWIAYLEKQKENAKSCDSIPSDCVSDAKCEDRSPKHTDSFGTDIRDTPAYWRGWDDAMKQKEQKPLSPDEKMNHSLYLEGFDVGREVGKVEAEQKPEDRFEEAREKYQVEWSEEDESKMGVIIRLVEQNSGWPYKAIKEYVTFLKSLRPSWKPSEEQMEALKCAIADVARFSKRGGRQVEFENEPYYSALHLLYCNLEKLM